AIGAESIAHRAMQDPEQLAAVDGVLRPPVAGCQAALFAEDPLAVTIEEDQRRRGDRGRRELVAEAQLDQLARGVREDVDADAEPPPLASGLGAVGAVEAGAGRARARRAAADAPADDDDLHAREAATTFRVGVT